MDLFVVLAAASLGTAHVVLPASCSPCTPTGSHRNSRASEGAAHGPNARRKYETRRFCTMRYCHDQTGAVGREGDESMPPAGASPMSPMWQDAGRSGHNITKREAGRVTGRCAVLIMLSPTQNSHPRDGECQFGESDTFKGTSCHLCLV